jgi:hypothetical protein
MSIFVSDIDFRCPGRLPAGGPPGCSWLWELPRAFICGWTDPSSSSSASGCRGEKAAIDEWLRVWRELRRTGIDTCGREGDMDDSFE